MRFPVPKLASTTHSHRLDQLSLAASSFLMSSICESNAKSNVGFRCTERTIAPSDPPGARLHGCFRTGTRCSPPGETVRRKSHLDISGNNPTCKLLHVFRFPIGYHCLSQRRVAGPERLLLSTCHSTILKSSAARKLCLSVLSERELMRYSCCSK